MYYGRIAELLREKGRQLYAVPMDSSVYEAVQEMDVKGVGALVVMDGRRLAGIFTERDVLRRMVHSNLDPVRTRVEEVMTPDPVTMDIGMKVEEAMALMTERRFRHLPIVENGLVVGMVSIGDLMRWVTLTLEDNLQFMTEYITGARHPT